MSISVSSDRCIAFKNKLHVDQCPNKIKKGCYCGIHLRAKKVVNFTLDRTNNVKINNIKPIKKISKNNTSILYLNNISKIIKVQSLFRRAIILNRLKCKNTEDFFTLENIVTMSSLYYYSLYDDDNKYGFDIRSLNKWLLDNNTNPYTTNEISTEIIKDAKDRFGKLENRLSKFKKDVLSTEQEFNNYVVDIFQNMNILGNYTYHGWFTELSHIELINLYVSCEDIWTYRAQLSKAQKSKITKNGIAFNIPIYLIKSLPETKKRYLELLLLNDFDKITKEGETDDDKKLGVHLILTGLVEVSPEAAQALPHLIQIV